MNASLNQKSQKHASYSSKIINYIQIIKQKYGISPILIFILILGLSIRVLLLFIPEMTWISSDTCTYMQMADAILAGRPMAIYPNGLPLLMAIVKFFFNSTHMLSILISINILLSTVIIWMTASIVKEITGKKILAILAACIVAIYPNQINYARLILTETPSCFLLTLFILFFLKKHFMLAGFVLFLATLFRSDLLLVFPLMFLTSIYFYRKFCLKKSLQFLFGYMLGILFYTILLNFGVVASTNRYGLEILKSINADSLQESYPGIDNFNEEEKLHPIKTYITYIIKNPQTYVLQRFEALENMWGWSPAPTRSLLSKLLIAIRLPLFILGILGFWKFRNNHAAWALLMPVLALTIIHVMTYSAPRYTLSVEPLVICLASLSLFGRLKNHELHSK